MAKHKVRDIPGRCYGVVATKKIASGSLIFADQPLLTVHRASPTYVDIEDAFSHLKKQDQDLYLSLYEGRSDHPLESKVVRIFHSNHFGTEHSKFILPLISRLNHSCVANAAVVNSALRAQQKIQLGEEITICYRESWDEVLTASQRNLLFKYRYGFQCTCKACLPRKNRWFSDRRRLLIGAIRFALEGGAPTDFSKIISFNDNVTSRAIMRKAHWPPKVPTIQPIRSASQRIEYTLLLAKLREAEGLGSMRVATTYVEAAGLLLDLQTRYLNLDILPGRHIWFPEAACCSIAWMQNAVEHATIGEGHNGETAERYRSTLQDMQTDMNPIVMAPLVMAGPDESGGVQARKCYALVVDGKMKGMPKKLTLRQSEAVLGVYNKAIHCKG